MLGDSAHDCVVREVAEARFGLDDWEVAVTSGSGGAPVPDIIAANSSRIVAVGEVETLDGVCEDRAEKWRLFGHSCVRFYLYVPDEAGEEAAQLIAKHKVPCAGLRSYSLNGKLEIRSVHIEGADHREDDHPWWLSIGGAESTC